jgi:RHS repeat-associated protein
VTYPNTNKVEYLYNVASELTTVTYKKGTTVLGTLTYTYDLAGNRIKTGGTFGRSNIPPALTTTTYNANNQQTAFGAATATYDLNGNLATFTDASGTTTYTWNTRNQLTAISGPGLTGSFTYDSFGRRTGKTINGTTTNFVYDGLNPVQEKNGATVTANLLTGLGIDEFFTRTDGVGVRALLPDALGSTVALGDGTGTLQTQYTYEPFGITTQTGLASTSSYKYTGREDDGTGLLYYRARYYQPRLQRFIAEDPLGIHGREVNLYGYVLNDPISLTDPLGLEACRGTWRLLIIRPAASFWNLIGAKRCECVWACIPCGGSVIWSGNPHTRDLPMTEGPTIFNPSSGSGQKLGGGRAGGGRGGSSSGRGGRGGGAPGSGNDCQCGTPGPETTCVGCGGLE